MYNWVPHILRSALLIVVNLCSLYWLDYGSSQCKDPKLIFSRKILFLKTKYSDQRKKRNKDNKKEREKGKKKTCYKEIYIYIYKFSNLSQTAVQWTLCTINSMFWCKRQHAVFSNLSSHGFLLQIYLKFCCGVPLFRQGLLRNDMLKLLLLTSLWYHFKLTEQLL